MRISLVVSVIASIGVALAPVAIAQVDEIPRAPSGKPDLSGNYDIANLTPFERDPKYGDKLIMSKEEAEAIERQAAAVAAMLARNSDPDREAPPPGGDGSAGPSGSVGGYNYFWLDPGSKTYSIDGEFRTSILTDPPNGRLPPLSEEGRARRKEQHPYAYKNTGDAWWLETGDDPYDGPESLYLVDRCIYVGVATVPAMSVPYNNLKTIVQTEDTIAILVEWMHWTRTVRLDSEHLPSDVRSLGGDSIGWWEGDTLVVDTTNFLEKPGVPREGLHVVERFTPMGAETLLYQFTVNDPDYVAPYSGEYIWPRTQDKLYEYACHEGNYAMGNILRGARMLEGEAMARRGESGGE